MMTAATLDAFLNSYIGLGELMDRGSHGRAKAVAVADI
jgi:hypothetical protein